jgi:two-component system nitrate/nitrite response regulator NarL
MGSVRIAIVDDHPLFRAGVARSLAESGDFEIVGEGSSHGDAVALVDRHRPDILILDISIPGGGLAAVQSILEKHEDQKIVMLTVSEAAGDVARAMKSGARGYILKGVQADSLGEILGSSRYSESRIERRPRWHTATSAIRGPEAPAYAAAHSPSAWLCGLPPFDRDCPAGGTGLARGIP